MTAAVQCRHMCTPYTSSSPMTIFGRRVGTRSGIWRYLAVNGVASIKYDFQDAPGSRTAWRLDQLTSGSSSPRSS